MKTYLIAIVLFLSENTNAQNYVPDPTFGTNGAVVTNYNMYYDNNQAPLNCFFLNNKYVFTQKTQMSAFNYDGSIDYTFGTFGYSRIIIPNFACNILSSKIIDNHIYLTGVKTNGWSIYEGLVAKMSFDGILDSSFGENGISTFPIGAMQIAGGENNSGIYDIAIKDGAIFVLGNSYYYTTYGSYRMFVSKLSLNGIIDTDFDSAGYKVYDNIHVRNAKAIFSYEDDLLLVADGGRDSMTSKAFIKIDENGNYVNEFGTNGVKAIVVCSSCPGSSERIDKVSLVDNSLYMLTTHTERNPFGWSRVQKVNLPDLQTTNLGSSDYFGKGNYLIDNDKVYIVGCDSYTGSSSATCPSGDFNLARRNLNGTLDTSFNQTGRYNFNFNPLSTENASLLIKHPDGRIMMAGYTTSRTSATAPYTGFAIARIADVSLNNIDFEIQHNFSIAPNPVQSVLNIGNLKNIIIDKISISDASGKIIFEINGNNSSINVEELSNGIYFIRINSEDKTEYLKFIKR